MLVLLNVETIQPTSSLVQLSRLYAAIRSLETSTLITFPEFPPKYQHSLHRVLRSLNLGITVSSNRNFEILFNFAWFARLTVFYL
ncbi:MAG: hypothetical protein HWQ41_21795 [Nostoc sp. NOS(2021)]|uniref:hypothetical protein n=1 Tax=Nostoc sp. NOS(2021) TaxID=2815407 RepID=UPI0025DD50C0|nr:hypothetical protein [Nostoc sp. NOS(2021)]MBN3897801.1 hypothetical protein [Nostoc sp. NOS(2021)]